MSNHFYFLEFHKMYETKETKEFQDIYYATGPEDRVWEEPESDGEEKVSRILTPPVALVLNVLGFLPPPSPTSPTVMWMVEHMHSVCDYVR